MPSPAFTMSSTAQPLNLAESNAHTPLVSSLLKPGGTRPGRQGITRSAQRPAARVAMSPTQRLLRRKAEAAWRSEVLRQALAALPPHKVPPRRFHAVNPDERMCQVHILTTGPVDLECGDIGLTADEFARPHSISAEKASPMVSVTPRMAGLMMDKTPLVGYKGGDYRLVPTFPLQVTGTDYYQARRCASRVTTRRVMAAVALLCIVGLIQALGLFWYASRRSSAMPT